MRRAWVDGVGVMLVAHATAGVVSAEPHAGEKAAFAITYAAPNGCPAEAVFIEQVAFRVGAERIAASADEPRTLRVRVRRRGDGFVGTLSLHNAVRTLHAATCAEAAKALALAAAIIIDPEAALNPRPTEEAPAREDTAANAEQPLPPASPAPESAPEPRIVAVAPRPLTLPDRISLPPSSERASWWLSAGPSFDVRSGLASEPALAAGVFVDVELARDTAISPALRLAGSLARATEDVPLGSANVQLLAIRLDACPLKLSAASSLDVQPCGTFEVGERHIAGRTAAETEAERRLWAAPGVVVRGRFSPVAELGIELQVASYVPLDRATITFTDPSTNQQQIRSAPDIGLSIGAAIATRFSP